MATITPISDGFDLENLDTVAACEVPKRMEVVDPSTKEIIMINGEPLWIELIGPDSEKYKKLNNKIVNGRIKANRKGGQITTEVLEQENKSLVAAVITGWSPQFKRGGVPFEFSTENAKILVNAYPTIYEQLNEFLGDRGNFLKN